MSGAGDPGVPERPFILVVAGPNGAGKTTAAPYLLRDFAGLTDFVNADQITQGLSGFDPESVARSISKEPDCPTPCSAI
jgi:predicted ABC-type ATPase